jgi:hypothetical protein
VDGPEFDAHLVDFNLLSKRNQAYRESEHQAMKKLDCKSLENPNW